MDILSYRGPHAAGGVSSALSVIWTDPRTSAKGWWYFAENSLRFAPMPHSPSLVASVDPHVVEGHYRFCNQFLWPLMHGLDEHCAFVESEHQHYQALQAVVGAKISQRNRRCSQLFVNDYHFALLPNLVTDHISLFWHIPWPSLVPPVWEPFIKDLAVRMLSAERIGFQTEEYATNFLRCLDKSLLRMALAKITVAPIGVDCELWESRATDPSITLTKSIDLLKTPYILSVDRIDYAKGVDERLRAIELLFENHPQLQGNLSFVQIGTRTRAGIAAYDTYWNLCTRRAEAINQRFGTADWNPILWLDQAFAAEDLAVIYREAAALLITSLRDGLNLTAKEYIACQTNAPGTLILSRSVGAWNELGSAAIGIDPHETESIMNGILTAISMSPIMRKDHLSALKIAVGQNSLVNWINKFETSNLASITKSSPGRTERVSRDAHFISRGR